MNAKENFLKEKELSQWWASIVNDERFSKVSAYALAYLAESCPTQEQSQGAVQFQHIIGTLATNDDPSTGLVPRPGLRHDLERNRGINQYKPKTEDK